MSDAVTPETMPQRAVVQFDCHRLANELIDAGDPPSTIPVLTLRPLELFIHGGSVVGAPAAPSRTRLFAAAPNPFNPRTLVAYDLAVPAQVRVQIFDLQGRRVRLLHDGGLDAGRHEFTVSTTLGRILSPEDYLARTAQGGWIPPTREVFPFIIGSMSFGALSPEAKVSLARGSTPSSRTG